MELLTTLVSQPIKCCQGMSLHVPRRHIHPQAPTDHMPRPFWCSGGHGCEETQLQKIRCVDRSNLRAGSHRPQAPPLFGVAGDTAARVHSCRKSDVLTDQTTPPVACHMTNCGFVSITTGAGVYSTYISTDQIMPTNLTQNNRKWADS